MMTVTGAHATITGTVPFKLSTEYVIPDGPLSELYNKSLEQQWNAQTDLNWNHQLAEDNPLAIHDASLPLFGTDIWGSMSSEKKTDVRQHVQSWQISQVFHSEQAALLCAAKIAQASDNLAVKLCGATQVADEARHVEVYSRLIRKFPHYYPLSSSLDRLLTNILERPEYDYAALGMQIVVEGLALGMFKMIQAYSKDPLVEKIQTLILRDEARHFAMGRITLSNFYIELTENERLQREEFLVEACRLLYQHFCADDVWEPIGLPRKACMELIRTSAVTSNFRRGMFRQLVPGIKSIGLMGKELTQYFTSIDVIDYAQFPSSTS